MLGMTGGEAVIGVQVGSTIADVLAKPIFGLLAYAIAITKTRQDLRLSEDDDLVATTPVVAGFKASGAD